MKLAPLFKFVKERWDIYQKKERGDPKPWTRDLILRDYRFTTPYRERDKVTLWIAKNWREPHKDETLVWFAMAVARYFNWPPTLEMIGYPLPWNAKRIVKLLNNHVQFNENRLMEKSHKNLDYKIERVKRSYKPQVFGGAYFLNSIGPKIESIVYDRLDKLWQNRAFITTHLEQASDLQEVYDTFHNQFGFGTFMAAQVVADIKYTPQFAPANMPDWWSWAASGPGSRRGLNRLCGRPVNAPWRESEWLEKLTELRAELTPRLVEWGMPPMHAQDVQGICCCEWDKYQRVKLGEGRPKQKYNGGCENGNRS